MTRPAICLAAWLLAAPVAADEPTAFDSQRLFTTAEQREQLDAARRSGGNDRDGDEGETISAAGVAEFDRETAQEMARNEDAPPPEIGLRGFVSRSDGPSAIWFADETGSASDRGWIDGNTVVVETPDGDFVRLKPGQTYNPETGEVEDVLGR